MVSGKHTDAVFGQCFWYNHQAWRRDDPYCRVLFDVLVYQQKNRLCDRDSFLLVVAHRAGHEARIQGRAAMDNRSGIFTGRGSDGSRDRFFISQRTHSGSGCLSCAPGSDVKAECT